MKATHVVGTGFTTYGVDYGPGDLVDATDWPNLPILVDQGFLRPLPTVPAGETNTTADETAAASGETIPPAGETNTTADETAAASGETIPPAGGTRASEPEPEQPAPLKEPEKEAPPAPSKPRRPTKPTKAGGRR